MPDSLVVLSTLCFLTGCTEKPVKKSLQDPDVTVVQPIDQEITRYLDYTGTTAPVETVDVRARVPGFLQKITFQPRAKVKSGDLLFLIDPRQYEASVKEAQAKLEAQKASSSLPRRSQINQQFERKP